MSGQVPVPMTTASSTMLSLSFTRNSGTGIFWMKKRGGGKERWREGEGWGGGEGGGGRRREGELLITLLSRLGSSVSTEH